MEMAGASDVFWLTKVFLIGGLKGYRTSSAWFGQMNDRQALAVSYCRGLLRHGYSMD